MNTPLYRPCVGLCIFNSHGQVFMGERIDTPGAWQMPQGGIDPGEDPQSAAYREMREEVGTDKASILRIHPYILRYTLPEDVRARLPWGKKYAGQDQTWIAMRFTGEDQDIRLDADEHAEFSGYRWVELEQITRFIVPFKKDTYEKVIEAFRDLAHT